MYISENDLKRRLLTAKLEIVDDILNELAPPYERAILNKQTCVVSQLQSLKDTYAEYRTILKNEKTTLEKEN